MIISKFRMWAADLTDVGIAEASAPTFTDEFAMVVTTTLANETFTIPAQNVGVFNAGVEWGDGSVSTINAFDAAALTHTYATPGDHLIRITGLFPAMGFRNAGDCLKVKSVENLGLVGWESLSGTFWGCSNMVSFKVGNTDTSQVRVFGSMLRDCSSLTSLDLRGIDTSSAITFDAMFLGCINLTSLNVSSFDISLASNTQSMFRQLSNLTSLNVSNFDTSAVTNMGAMFQDGTSFTDIIGVENFNIEALDAVGDLNNFMRNVTLPTARYDALLINWAAQNPFGGMTPNFGLSKYTPGGEAEAARSKLITTDGWVISDGGPA